MATIGPEPDALERRPQPVAERDGRRCRWPERLLADCHRPLVEGPGISVAALAVINKSEAIQRCGNRRMARPERFFMNHQGAFQERFGVGVAALGDIKRAEIVERSGNVNVVVAKRRLPTNACKAARRQRTGLGVDREAPDC